MFIGGEFSIQCILNSTLTADIDMHKSIFNLRSMLSKFWLYSTDVCYTENDAYIIVDHGEKCQPGGENASADKEPNKAIYEEVSKEFWTLEMYNVCIISLCSQLVLQYVVKFQYNLMVHIYIM